VAASIFDDKSKRPTASEIDAALGESATLLEDIERYLAGSSSIAKRRADPFISTSELQETSRL
jgi:hypothetical protein